MIYARFFRQLGVARPAVFLAVRAVGGKAVIVTQDGVEAHRMQIVQPFVRTAEIARPFQIGMHEMRREPAHARIAAHFDVAESVIDEFGFKESFLIADDDGVRLVFHFGIENVHAVARVIAPPVRQAVGIDEFRPRAALSRKRTRAVARDIFAEIVERIPLAFRDGNGKKPLAFPDGRQCLRRQDAAWRRHDLRGAVGLYGYARIVRFAARSALETTGTVPDEPIPVRINKFPVRFPTEISFSGSRATPRGKIPRYRAWSGCTSRPPARRENRSPLREDIPQLRKPYRAHACRTA